MPARSILSATGIPPIALRGGDQDRVARGRRREGLSLHGALGGGNGHRRRRRRVTANRKRRPTVADIEVSPLQFIGDDPCRCRLQPSAIKVDGERAYASGA